MKKKYLALVLAACMTASLAACGSTAADTSAPAATTEEAADTAAAESTEAADTAAATGEHGPSSEAAPAWEDYDARIAAIRSETDLVKREALMHEAEDEPQFYFRTTDVTGVCELPAGTEMCMPGDNVEMTIELIHPVAMEQGLTFAIREGGRTVGSGRVVSIIE